MTPDQLWVQPDGRAMLVDPLGLGGAEEAGSTGAAEGPLERAREFLYRVTCLALEGGRRRRPEDPLRAPIPMHARTMIEGLRLSGEGCRDFEQLHDDLHRTQDLPVEVTRRLRAAGLGGTVAVLLVGLLVQFGVVFGVLTGFFVNPGVSDASGATHPLSVPRAEQLGYGVTAALALAWIVVAGATRGGLVFSILGLTLARRDGRLASPWRSAWRSTLVWLPPALLLAGAIYFGVGAAPGLSWNLFWAAAATLAAYPALALISPSRGPHDYLAGTVVVPR